ncbi:MAG: Gfo/Idh/MocA family oxidoreductase, partial [Acidobacteriota bacterium]|nr:Gfo/Idh/MocA family oxidoreductase [Acidobacteriota bacterium]
MKLAVIGAGYWGPNLVRVFVQHPDVRSVVVCDIDQSRLDRMLKLYPAVEVASDFDRVLTDETIDAVVIAVPAALHYDFARRALLAGKDVLVEKPLASTVSEGEDLCRLAQDGQRVLMVGHTFLFNAAVRKVKEYIDGGALGDVYYVYAHRLNLGIVRKDVDALWNLAPHDVSILLHWLGNTLPEEVTCHGASYLQNGVDDVSFLILRFPSGVLGHIHVSWLDPSKVRRMTVVGSQKMVVYDDASAEARVRLYDKGIDRQQIDSHLGRFEDFAEFQLLHRAGDLLIPRVDFTEPLKEEAEHFVRCIKDRATPVADGSNGVRILRVLEAADQS